MNKIEVRNINPDTNKNPFDDEQNRRVYIKVENKERKLNGPYNVPVTEIRDGKAHMTPSNISVMEHLIYKNSVGGYANATNEEDVLRELVYEIKELIENPENFISGDFEPTFEEKVEYYLLLLKNFFKTKE